MARGKQAAASARRKATRAQEKTDEVKSRLQAEREQSDQEIKNLKAEVHRLKTDHLLEAQRLAAEEISRVRAEHEETTAQLKAVVEGAQQIMYTKDYLVANACRYISMTIGDTPLEALDMVVTWMTGEDFHEEILNYEAFLERLALPPDGWVGTLWKRNKHLNPLRTGSAISLENAEKVGHDRIHKDYNPAWYSHAGDFIDVNKIKRGDIRRTRSGVTNVAVTRFALSPRRTTV